MARAKRTDRAEARRRHRIATGDLLDDHLDEDAPESGDATARSSTARAASAAPSSGRPARPSIIAAFRSSFRPLDLRGDLRALPTLVRHWSFFVPVILAGLSVAVVPLLGVSALSVTIYQYFSGTVPIASVFLAGFFAPRASWLVGALVGLASVAFQALAFSVGPYGGYLDIFVDPNTNAALPANQVASLILSSALFTGVPISAFFAAAAAWYRRFLRRANPNRTARPVQTTSRRPDGKIPKRNEQRPILARRR